MGNLPDGMYNSSVIIPDEWNKEARAYYEEEAKRKVVNFFVEKLFSGHWFSVRINQKWDREYHYKYGYPPNADRLTYTIEIHPTIERQYERLSLLSWDDLGWSEIPVPKTYRKVKWYDRLLKKMGLQRI